MPGTVEQLNAAFYFGQVTILPEASRVAPPLPHCHAARLPAVGPELACLRGARTAWHDRCMHRGPCRPASSKTFGTRLPGWPLRWPAAWLCTPLSGECGGCTCKPCGAAAARGRLGGQQAATAGLTRLGCWRCCRGLLIWRRRRVAQFFEVNAAATACRAACKLHGYLVRLPALPTCLTAGAHCCTPAPQWPRPELWLLWCLLPILAAQGASAPALACRHTPARSCGTLQMGVFRCADRCLTRAFPALPPCRVRRRQRRRRGGGRLLRPAHPPGRRGRLLLPHPAVPDSRRPHAPGGGSGAVADAF